MLSDKESPLAMETKLISGLGRSPWREEGYRLGNLNLEELP